MPLVNTDRLVSSRRYLMAQQRERRFACLAPEALGPLIRASFVRTLRSRPQRNPVRFTSYAATTRVRRSRSNVLHSAHGSAYAAGQQHSLPPHTRKVAGSKPAGTTTKTPVQRWFLRSVERTVGLLRTSHPANIRPNDSADPAGDYGRSPRTSSRASNAEAMSSSSSSYRSA